MTLKNILNIVPTMQAAALVGDIAKSSKKKQTVGSQLHSATKILVGTSLIQAESKLIGAL